MYDNMLNKTAKHLDENSLDDGFVRKNLEPCDFLKIHPKPIINENYLQNLKQTSGKNEVYIKNKKR